MKKIVGAPLNLGVPQIRAPSENAAKIAADSPTQHRRRREQQGTREAGLCQGGLCNTLGLLNAFYFVFVGAVGSGIRRLLLAYHRAQHAKATHRCLHSSEEVSAAAVLQKTAGHLVW